MRKLCSISTTTSGSSSTTSTFAGRDGRPASTRAVKAEASSCADW
ncbi:hypothetical protein ACLESD_16540 [Pyxidicoccus sp. 3LFB2]